MPGTLIGGHMVIHRNYENRDSDNDDLVVKSRDLLRQGHCGVDHRNIEYMSS